MQELKGGLENLPLSASIQPTRLAKAPVLESEMRFRNHLCGK
jgi:hypothetical protein